MPCFMEIQFTCKHCTKLRSLLCFVSRYTLRNAEYRLSFERNLELSEEVAECPKSDVTEDNHDNINLGKPVTIFRVSEDFMPHPGKSDEESSYENMGEELGDLTPQAEEYIIQMQSRLDAMKKVTIVCCFISQTISFTTMIHYLALYLLQFMVFEALWRWGYTSTPW